MTIPGCEGNHCTSCIHVRYETRCTILPWTGEPCARWESAYPERTDPLAEILRLGASAEVAAAWVALAEWAARPETDTERRLLRAYRVASGAHARNVEALEEYLDADTEGQP